ncbi:MAG: putative peptidoglycan glycosyltransferase FtsW [Aquiluna sp.]|nr:putative peptidoglycan glycosyltransferase FtsW [Aquiluna sp.]
MTSAKQEMRHTFRAQSKPYYFLLATTLFTVMLGLAMVASASSVDSFKETANAGSTVFRQGGFAIIGIIALAIVSTLPVQLLRKVGLLALYVTLGLQVLTVFFGIEINGNRNWLSLGFTSIQPSEFLKLGMILAFAHQLSKLTDDPLRNRQVWIWLGGYSMFALVLVVLMGKDMGTGVVMAVMLLGMFLIAGLPWSYFFSVCLLGALAVVALVIQSPSRLVRFEAWLNPSAADPMGVNWQYQHGTWALASGGIWGTGLGRSKLKWSWIPEVENDFIFAVIGEELGLFGALFVIALFLIMGLAMFTIAKRQTNSFSRNLVVGVMLWIVMQAMINISVVLGLLPVLGVPLPLISAGGSSLISTLAAIGVVLAVERDRVSKLGRSAA